MTDEEEMDFIYNYVTSDVWIGGKRSCTSCTWEWINGGVIKYFNWKEGEPNNDKYNKEIGKKQENCIESINDPKWSKVWYGRWNDAPCEIKKEFLCKSV